MVRPPHTANLLDALRLTRWPDGMPRVPVLLYHMITRPGRHCDPSMAVSQTRFDRQLAYLDRAGYVCISLSRLVAYVRDGQPVPPRSFAITFDDGFLDTYRLARPVLRRHRMTATVFLVSDLIGGLSEWMRAEPSGPQLLMAADMILRMQADGIDFASHGCTHAHLANLSPDQLTEELVRSRRDLSDLLGREVTTLGYPYGQFDAHVRAAADAAGYTAAVSVIAGGNHTATDPLAIRRTVVTGTDEGPSLLIKMVLGEQTLRWRTIAPRLARTLL